MLRRIVRPACRQEEADLIVKWSLSRIIRLMDQHLTPRNKRQWVFICIINAHISTNQYFSGHFMWESWTSHTFCFVYEIIYTGTCISVEVFNMNHVFESEVSEPVAIPVYSVIQHQPGHKRDHSHDYVDIDLLTGCSPASTEYFSMAQPTPPTYSHVNRDHRSTTPMRRQG